jgi:hypothetical protein
MSRRRESILVVYRIWLLKLVFPFPYGRLITGLLLLSVLVPVFYQGVREGEAGNTPALFFSLCIAYIIPIFSLITARAREALLELRPTLNLDDREFEDRLMRLESTSLPLILFQLGFGTLGAVAHLSLMQGSVPAWITDIMTSQTARVSSLGALLVWVVMTTVISMLVQQAIVFARLGAREVRVSLLSTRKLVPFARVAIMSSLAIIGALALFPLMNVESAMSLSQILPGAIATSSVLIVIFIVPVWPVHRRIAAMKEDELSSLDRRIEDCLGGGDGTDLGAAAMEQVAPLLHYRREIAELSTWPFDTGVVARLTLYLIIPPLTWAGAALIEKLVDSVV